MSKREPNLPPALLHARILIVDDHPGMASTLARAVSQLGPGIEVLSATGGREALQQVKDLPVDLVITDMMMPEMNGMELIETLRAHPAGRPAFSILMTAYDVPGLKESARRLKINEMIVKPFPPERLCQIVARALEALDRTRPSQSPGEARPAFKILIADDVADNVALLARYLQGEGFGFITASNGIETLEMTRAEMPDMILLDVNMPKKDGFEVLRELRADEALEHIPVIILTAARIDSKDIQTGLNLGADDYMTKPFDRRELLARIRTKLRAKETEDSIRRRSREFSVLPEIGREFSGRLDQEELMEVILRRTIESLGAVFGRIVILEPDGTRSKDYRAGDQSSLPADVYLPAPEVFFDSPLNSWQGVFIADTLTDSRCQAAADNPVRSLLIEPLLGRLSQLGWLILAHEKPGYFSPDHGLFLQAIASQASIALENARLAQQQLQQAPTASGK